MCQKGWTSPALLRHTDRLTTPLLHGEPVSWDTALSFVATRLSALRESHARSPWRCSVAGG